MTLFWLQWLRALVPNHLITANITEYPQELQSYADQLEGRSMLVRRAKMIDIECVARAICRDRAGRNIRCAAACAAFRFLTA